MKNRQSAVLGWILVAILFVAMAVAGTMDCRDKEEVEKFSQEWRILPCANGELLWVRVGGRDDGSYRDTMQLVQSKKLSTKR